MGLALHKVTQPIVMGILFVVAVIPTGLVLKVFGMDPLRLKLDNSASTYWIQRQQSASDSDSFVNQF